MFQKPLLKAATMKNKTEQALRKESSSIKARLQDCRKETKEATDENDKRQAAEQIFVQKGLLHLISRSSLMFYF